MKIKILFLGIVVALAMAFQQPARLTKTKISDEISTSLPEHFQPVSQQDLSAKYVSSRPPIALYTSPDKQVDFSVNVSINQWQQFDLPLVKDFYKASLSTLFSDLKFLKEETTEINKHPAALFEFVGTVEGEEGTVKRSASISKYHYVAYILVNGKVAVFTLTAPANRQQEWSPVAEEIMQSIRIKKTL